MEDNEVDRISVWLTLSLSHCCCVMEDNEVDQCLVDIIAESLLLCDGGQ